MQYFLASHGFKLGACAGALISAVVVGSFCEEFSIWAVIAIILAFPLGSVLGFLFLSPIVGAIAGKLNGAPFRLGDVVHILTGPHRDRVGHIYTMWIERSQVRVQLDERAKKETADVFGDHEICREHDAS